MVAETAFEQFYRDNVRAIHAFAALRLGQDDAADLTAEVFHAAALLVSDGRGDDLSTAWLYGVARNKIIDQWRKATVRAAKAHLIRLRRDEAADFPPDWASDARREQVLDALDQLTPRHRALLILHHVEGLPIAEVVEVLGSTPAATESALARARAAFRRAYMTAGTRQ